MKRNITFKIRKLDITFDLLLIIISLIMLVTGYLLEFLIVLTSIFLHELGHILIAAYLGCEISELRILPIGLNAVLDDNMCCMKEKLTINFSGPFVSILLFFSPILLILLGLPKYDLLIFFIWTNAYLFAFNLLPVLPLDGGRILREVLSERFGIFFASRFVRRFSLFLSSLIVVIGLIQFLLYKYNFSLLIIGIYIVSTSTFKKTEAAIMNIKSVIYRRSRLLKKGIYPARDLVVVKNIPISELLRNMDFDRFHIIHVLDEDLKLLKIYTEQEIIEGMLKYETDMTFDEFIKIDS